MSIVKKLLDIDQRIIYLLVFASLAYPILYPLKLPMAIQDYSQQAFDFAESIPSGSVVLLESSLGPPTYPQGGPGMVCQIIHMLEKDVKIIFFSSSAAAALFTEIAIDTAIAKLPSNVPVENGVNWVHLGYVSGGESGIAALVNDIRSVVSKDHFGVLVDDRPLMENINDASDFKAVLWWCGSAGNIPHAVRHIVEPFGVPMSGMCTTNEVPNYSPYIDSGQLQGLWGGVRGSAEYEFLLNKPGPALGQAMATNFGGLLWALLIILGNVLYFVQRMRGEG